MLVIGACILMWATCGYVPRSAAADSAPASVPAQGQPAASAPSESGAAAALPEVAGELAALRSAIEHARFEEARTRASELLARGELRAGERNAALELLAIAQVAARDEAGARLTLRALFARDPEHREQLRDPGPAVNAAFARARSEAIEAVAPELTARLLRAPNGYGIAEVTLARDRDAVESVHVFARGDRGAHSHVIEEVGDDATLRIPLPPLAPRADHSLELYVEARAPSGVVLARSGSASAPLLFALPPARGPCAASAGPPPLRRAWWLWTSVAIVVLGLGVSGAIAAQ